MKKKVDKMSLDLKQKTENTNINNTANDKNEKTLNEKDPEMSSIENEYNCTLNDIPDNSVVRGVPAKTMCTIDQLYDIMKAKSSYPDELTPIMGSFVGKELEDWLWNRFESYRKR